MDNFPELFTVLRWFTIAVIAVIAVLGSIGLVHVALVSTHPVLAGESPAPGRRGLGRRVVWEAVTGTVRSAAVGASLGAGLGTGLTLAGQYCLTTIAPLYLQPEWSIWTVLTPFASTIGLSVIAGALTGAATALRVQYSRPPRPTSATAQAAEPAIAISNNAQPAEA